MVRGFLIVVLCIFFSGCAGGPVYGSLFNDTTYNKDDTAHAIYDTQNGDSSSGYKTSASKEGRATCTGILGLVAFGDCSIEAAAKDGGITKIESVTNESFSVLGIYTTYTTVVKGE